ncbi:WD40 repeat-like protein [Setomelanomma holmii]|uniref:WD40 repeat-like protein n=1 Tax=Setomelanomma holmii TaxID=210430 RepID=A0A9P4HG12_9PLEO|nr:WD40 repeat-like protein [Setomelanomma holmii]
MADTTPQLKRKRESLTGTQKKPKKQRKSEAIAEQNAGPVEEVANATPVAEPPSQSQTTAKAQDRAKGRSRKPQTDGALENATATTTTPSTAKQGNNQAKKLSNGDLGGLEVDVISTSTPLKQGKKQKKENQNDDKQTDGLNKDENQVEVVDAQGTPARFTPQTQSTEKVSKKQAKLERQALAKVNRDMQVSEAGKSQLSKPKKFKHKNAPTWAVSPAQGGWFLPIDPIYSLDEKYLLLANNKALQIYFTDTSLLASPSQVYVADSNGLITLWDWVDGKKIGRWDIGSTVRNMAVIAQPGSEEDLVYCHETGSSHVVNVHALRTKSQSSKTELKRVLKTTSQITSIQVLLQGKYVIIATAESITVGKRVKVSKTAVQDFEYVWRELKFSKRITTCNTFFRQPKASENGKKTAQDQRDILDIAVGDEIGVVLLFEDILAGFAMVESTQKGNKSRTDTAESLRPKLLHWHRDAVGAVKWSLDGNYLISGGDETVLTIWQLTTGKPQHLPHLSAAIENIVVSPSGSSYALSLANNSIVVLSTTELEAKTNIIGIQTRRVEPEQLPKVSGAPSTYALQPVPIVVDPKNAQHVLFTVPSSQPRQRNEGLRSEPYLQTFDIANQRAVTRQALTRNNATEPNMAPDGRRVAEPGVKHLQASCDGQYLATIDEWTPPKADTAYLNEGNAAISEEERLLRREVYLKIWRRDDRNGGWALETRIDAPHMLEDIGRNSRVLDLIAHPTAHSFASIGEDHIVRIWKPKTRLRDGIVVRGADKQGLVNWSMSRTIELPNPEKLWLYEGSAGSLHARQHRLAFSADGSILAAAVSGASDTDSGLIYLIDANAGTIRRSMTEIDVRALCGVGIVGRYLVAVSDCVTVWDLVNDNLVYTAPVNTAGLDENERTSVVRLVVNEADGTFAVSFPQFEKNEASSGRIKKASSKVAIYSTEQKEPMWSHTLPGVTLGLAARKGTGEKGYVALDSVSCIRVISPAAGRLTLPAPQPVEESEVHRIEDSRAEVDDTADGEASRALEDIILENEYDKPVVTQQDLETIFHNDNAPQAPKDVFSAVLSLFGGVAKAAA